METPRRVLRNQHVENVQQLSTPFKIPASPFMKSLGYGTGVNVFRLERSPKSGQTRSPWAVKRTSKNFRTTGDTQFNARIEKEAEILRKLSHPNIVGFRGITKSKDGTHSLILECCKTSLGTILEERNEEKFGPLPAKDTIKMILDVSHALDYLHTEAKLLHGDLKSFNVLVKGDFEICKLCDFGVSLPLDQNGLIDFSKNPHLKYVGTQLWSAPEVLDDLEIIDCKADIFSFGLVIYETIALIPPHTVNLASDDDLDGTDKSTDTSLDKAECSAVDNSLLVNQIEVALGTRPPLPQAFELTDDYNRIVELFYCCTNELAEDRPKAKTIWESLHNVATEDTN